MVKRWYVVRVYSGLESRVKQSLTERIEFAGLEDQFGEILIPTDEIVEIRYGKKRKSERKFFSGYILVQINMNDETWHLVRNVPKVLGFIGGTSEHPAPITDQEASNILQQLKTCADKPKPKILFEPGELVRVINGPLSDFSGAVEEVNYAKNRLRVALLIFGRSTPVNLDFSQVGKS